MPRPYALPVEEVSCPEGECHMGKRVKLVHSRHRSRLEEVLRDGLKATSEFDDLGLEMRRGVVYCWMRKEDDKMWGQKPDHVYFEVTVAEDRCRVAEMDFASIAMMYLQGDRKPKNAEAAGLLAQVYKVTSVPLSDYTEGRFWTPEVLVKGDIDPECIGLPGEDAQSDDVV